MGSGKIGRQGNVHSQLFSQSGSINERDVHCVQKACLEQRVERPYDDGKVALTFPFPRLDNLAWLTMKRRMGPLW